MWVWVNSGSWWWTGRSGVLQFMGSQRVGHDWATELNWTELNWDECSCVVVWTFFGIGMKSDLFQSCGHCRVFQICWHIECSTFTASSFRIWNNSTGIPSPPLVLFMWCFLRPTWLCIARCLTLGEWSHHYGYLGCEDLFCIVLLCFLATSS